MKARKIILNAAVVLLMLVFSQKSGAGLFVHNLLHAATSESSVPSDSKSSTDLGIACNCIDDFLAPFTEGTTVQFAAPVFNNHSPLSVFAEDLDVVSLFPPSQRGPPAGLL